jgi:hypothetical protein
VPFASFDAGNSVHSTGDDDAQPLPKSNDFDACFDWIGVVASRGMTVPFGRDSRTESRGSFPQTR